MTLEVHYDSAKRVFTIPVPGGAPIPAINEWPGWKRMPTGTYYAPAWPSSIIAMSKTTQPLRWDPAAAQARDGLLEDLRLMRDALSRDSWNPGRLPTERRPKLHQRQAVTALRYAHWRALLGDDMGLGKTSTALWAAHDADFTSIVVVCPVSVKFNWQAEIRETLGDWPTIVIDGSAKKRAQQFAEACALPGKRAVIINYDLLRHLPDLQLGMLTGIASKGIIFFDESHYLKNRDSERTKLSALVASRTQHVLGITGTSIRNLADDLFSQVEIIRPGTWTSYRDFAKRHLVIQAVKFGKREVHKVVGVKNLDALNAVMNTMQIKRKKEDVLDLPPKVYTFPDLQLEDEHAKLYKAMKEFAKIELSKFSVDNKLATIFDPRARSAVEQAMRCEQIANGFCGGIPDPLMAKLGDVMKLAEKIPGRPNELMFPSSPKVTWLRETIDSILAQGGAPIIGSRFNAPLHWLYAKLFEEGVRPGFIHGGVSAEDRDIILTEFKEGRIEVLLTQVKIAEGWNATRSQDVIHWTRDWSPAINAQFEDRTHRMGQKGTVNVQVPIVRKTIETMIDNRLRRKGADAEQALRTVTIEELMEAL